MDVFEYFMGVLVILDSCPGDIWMVSWRYLMGVF